jgi:hypothetical protein
MCTASVPRRVGRASAVVSSEDAWKRRAANERLGALKGVVLEADVDEIESRTKDRILALSRSSFKKVPDAPLGEVVLRKIRNRARQAKGRKSR